jgi:hypothetical protein
MLYAFLFAYRTGHPNCFQPYHNLLPLVGPIPMSVELQIPVEYSNGVAHVCAALRNVFAEPRGGPRSQ